MKKISLLLALLLCVTIGGVYATFNYATSGVTAANDNQTITVAGVGEAGTVGEYSVDATTLTLKIDNKGGNTNITELTIEGYVTLTFKPSAFASETVKDKGTSSVWALSLTGDYVSNNNLSYQYESGETAVNVFSTFDTSAQTFTWSDDDNDGTFTCTIQATTLANLIKLNEIELSSSDRHAKYSSLFTNLQIVITLSDATTSA